MSQDILKMAEIFSQMTVTALASHIRDTVGTPEQPAEMSKMLLLQSRIQESLQTWETLKGDTATFLHKAAQHRHSNEETNVDPLTGPWDVSTSPDGTWVRAWVWLPDVVKDNQW